MFCGRISIFLCMDFYHKLYRPRMQHNPPPPIETHRQEFKETLADTLEREVVAFLNANGGKIYIGISDDGTAIGVDNSDTIQLQIKDRLINNIRPRIMGLFDIFVELHDDKPVVVVNLAGGMDTPYYIRKYGRSEKGKLLNVNFAKTLDFLTPDGRYNQLAFLFADNNSISIRIAKWWGTDKIDLRENEEYGECSLIKAMQKVLDKFDIENVTFARKVGIGPREEKKLVDSKALREAIINSFAHNDYTYGDTPVFEIFADRFEFTTYGGLVEGMTQNEFFSGVSRPRNPEVMRIFKDLEYVERLGSGIPYIVSKYGEGIFKLMPSVIRFSYLYDTIVDTENIFQETTKKPPRNHQETTKKPPRNHIKFCWKYKKIHLLSEMI